MVTENPLAQQQHQGCVDAWVPSCNLTLALIQAFSSERNLQCFAMRFVGVPRPETTFCVQVWNGHVRESELVLLDVPVALQSFWTPNAAEVRLAVAAGADVYIYHGIKIQQKVPLPHEQVESEDALAWCVTQADHVPFPPSKSPTPTKRRPWSSPCYMHDRRPC